jgi:Aspartyl protease
MEFLFKTRPVPLLALVSLALIVCSSAQAETPCPGSVASVTPRFVQRALIVVPVKINSAGPFDFMVDTGSQVTVIDPSLASELGLKSEGSVSLTTVGSRLEASTTVLGTLEAGSQLVEKASAIVQDLGQIRAADPRIRGVLGESFLDRFDLLVDYRHQLVCLDETGRMRSSVQGEHIPFLRPQDPEEEMRSGEARFMERLVLSVQLSGTGKQPILLQLDSGSDGPILYPGSERKEVQTLLQVATLPQVDVHSEQRTFAVVPAQNVRIGRQSLNNISFVTPLNTAKGLPRRQEDGLLPTVLFQRFFISGDGHYVIFNPK